MKRHRLLIWGLVLVLVGLLGLVAVDAVAPRFAARYETGRGYRRGRTDGPGGMMGPGGFMMRDYSKARYASNGEEIFLTGRSSSGGRVYSNFGMMRVGCANCHGADGAGGLVLPDGTESADIRAKSLAKEGMTEADVRRAITEGVDEEGKLLSEYMPRWTMDERELTDLMAYLKTL